MGKLVGSLDEAICAEEDTFSSLIRLPLKERAGEKIEEDSLPRLGISELW